jgi:2-(1,2-epoxy-1,2-dihydrophenyl)acetyl-CoA isomerase
MNTPATPSTPSSTAATAAAEHSGQVLWHEAKGVGHIVLDRPGMANALSFDMAQQLLAAVRQAQASSVGAVLLSARGKQFCAGGDIQEFVANRHRLDALAADILAVAHPAVHQLASLPVPVISALQGPLGGAGISLALCADLVLASSSMFMRGGYSAIGLSPDLGASYFLARRASPARAKYVLMTNRPIPAQQCLDWGLVDELHAPDALMPAAIALAEQLAAGATGSLGGLKRLCDAALTHDLASHLDAERAALLRCAASNDGREGVSAFMEKRAPQFSGAGQ